MAQSTNEQKTSHKVPNSSNQPNASNGTNGTESGGPDKEFEFELKFTEDKGYCMEERFFFPEDYGQVRDNEDRKQNWEMMVDTGNPYTQFDLMGHHRLLPQRFLECLVCLPPGYVHDTIVVAKDWEDYSTHHVSVFCTPVEFLEELTVIDIMTDREADTPVIIGMDLLRTTRLVINDYDDDDDQKQKKTKKDYVIFFKSHLQECAAARGGKDYKLSEFLAELTKHRIELQNERKPQKKAKQADIMERNTCSGWDTEPEIDR